jgi:lipopolysaccharide biosynthesis glycosyltransferase
VSALVFASDENHARALAVAVHSALDHLPRRESPELYILDNGIADASRDRLVRLANAAGAALRWVEVPEARLSHLESVLPRPSQPNSAHHITRATWARLLIPELLPGYVSRAVYLDNDVLVRRDLSPLFELDLDGASLAAVGDFAVASEPHPLWGECAEPYFNSGVLVIDVQRWRSAALASRALAQAAAQEPPFPFADQDALNVVVDDWCELSPEWNVQQGFLWRPALTESLSQQRETLYDRAGILHFTGASKPWHPDSTTPGTTAWARELVRSGWYTRVESAGWLAAWLSRRLVGATARRGAALLRRGSRLRALARRLDRPGTRSLYAAALSVVTT